jgi:hypothetical protein
MLAMKNEMKISIREYAKTLDIRESAIRKAITEGRINKGYDKVSKKIIPSFANKEYGFLHKVAKPMPGQSKTKLISKIENKLSKKISKCAPPGEVVPAAPPEDLSHEDASGSISSIKISKTMSHSDAIRKRELIGVALDKIKLQEAEGVLVRRDEVEKALFAFGSELKKALMNIPNRIASEMRVAKNDVEAQIIMTIELTEILTQFSNMEQVPKIG